LTSPPKRIKSWISEISSSILTGSRLISLSGLETHSGKPVTTVEPHRLIGDSIELPRLAHRLKERLGTGGEVENDRINLHGDQRDGVGEELAKLGGCS
jgi:translation initiation factor 1 (eIF-1/SUI1)